MNVDLFLVRFRSFFCVSPFLYFFLFMTLKVFAETASRLQNAVQKKQRLFLAPSYPLIRDFFALLEYHGYIEGVTSVAEDIPLDTGRGRKNRRHSFRWTRPHIHQLLVGLKYSESPQLKGSFTKVLFSSYPSKRTAYSLKNLHYLKKTSTSSHCLYVFLTNKGVLSLDQCLEQKVGGFLFCRVL